eukprot:g6562.t1
MNPRQPSNSSATELADANQLSATAANIRSHRLSYRAESDSFREPDYAAPHANHTTALVPDEGVLGFLRRTVFGASTVAPPIGASDVAERLGHQFMIPKQTSEEKRRQSSSAIPIPRYPSSQQSVDDDKRGVVENGLVSTSSNEARSKSKSEEIQDFKNVTVDTSEQSERSRRELNSSIVSISDAILEPGVEALEEKKLTVDERGDSAPDASTSSGLMDSSVEDTGFNFPSKKGKELLSRDRTKDNQSSEAQEGRVEDEEVKESLVMDQLTGDENQQQESIALEKEAKGLGSGLHGIDAIVNGVSMAHSSSEKLPVQRSQTMLDIGFDKNADSDSEKRVNKSASQGNLDHHLNTPDFISFTAEDNLNTSKTQENEEMKTPETQDSHNKAESTPLHLSLENSGSSLLELSLAGDRTEEFLQSGKPDTESNLEHVASSTNDSGSSPHTLDPNNTSSDATLAECEMVKLLWMERMKQAGKEVSEEHHGKSTEFPTPLAYFLDFHIFIKNRKYSISLLEVLISHYGEDHPRVQEFIEAIAEDDLKEQALQNGMPQETESELGSLHQQQDSAGNETYTAFDTAKTKSAMMNSGESSSSFLKKPVESNLDKKQSKSKKSSGSAGVETDAMSETDTGLVVSRKNVSERQYRPHYGNRKPSCFFCCVAPRAD